MKKTFDYISVAVLTVLAVGCAKLDTAPTGDVITSEQKQEVVSLDGSKASAGVNAIFSQMKTYMPNYDLIGSLHNDFGYAALMMFMDQTGFDMVAKDDGYNWAGNSLDFTDRLYTSNESIIYWNTLYQQIYSANNVIGGINLESIDETAMYYLAQALGARAFNYWVLAQLYQFNYKGHETSPCVPIVTQDNMGQVGTDGVARNTVQEVYSLILSDLDLAISCLSHSGVTPADKRYISLATAYGLRARVNLTMQNWDGALKDAQNAIANFSGRPYQMDELTKPGFWNSADAAVMWAIVVAETDDVVQSGIVNWPSHIGSLNYGYTNYSKGKAINKMLFNSISDTDVRRGWFIDADGYSANLNAEQTQWMVDYAYPAYTNVKFGPYNDVVGQSTSANDINLMRIEEMYLIKAEAQANLNQTDAAANTLQNLIGTYRDPGYAASSYSDIKEEIYRQRRIEFWGEGLSWFDIMRLGKDVDRRGAGFEPSMVFNIPAGSNILLYRIPQSEIEANAKISETDNNPVAPVPDPVSE